MWLLKTFAAAATLAAILPLRVHQHATLLTVPQHDAWRSSHDPPSASVSANGRYVAFVSHAQLVPADSNRQRDVYVLDRTTGQATLESVASDDGSAKGDSDHPRLSGDGRLLVYTTTLPSPHGGTSHVVLRHRGDGTTTVITAVGGDASAQRWSQNPVISGDGRTVVFASSANLMPAGAAHAARQDLYAYDVGTRSLRRVAADPVRSARSSAAPAIDQDARIAAFTSTAPGTPSEVLVCDTQLNVVRTIRSGGGMPNGASWSPAIDAGGRYVAFVSAATNLTPGDRNRAPDVFVADLRTGNIELISRRVGGGTANGASLMPALSADGRFVAFQSDASDLVCARDCAGREDINLLWDVFLYDREKRTMSRVSGDGDQVWMEASGGPALDARGEVIAFSSRHPIDANDVRNDFDLFVRVDGQNARLAPDRSIGRHSISPLLGGR